MATKLEVAEDWEEFLQKKYSHSNDKTLVSTSIFNDYNQILIIL